MILTCHLNVKCTHNDSFANIFIGNNNVNKSYINNSPIKMFIGNKPLSKDEQCNKEFNIYYTQTDENGKSMYVSPSIKEVNYNNGRLSIIGGCSPSGNRVLIDKCNYDNYPEFHGGGSYYKSEMVTFDNKQYLSIGAMNSFSYNFVGSADYGVRNKSCTYNPSTKVYTYNWTSYVDFWISGKCDNHNNNQVVSFVYDHKSTEGPTEKPTSSPTTGAKLYICGIGCRGHITLTGDNGQKYQTNFSSKSSEQWNSSFSGFYYLSGASNYEVSSISIEGGSHVVSDNQGGTAQGWRITAWLKSSSPSGMNNSNDYYYGSHNYYTTGNRVNGTLTLNAGAGTIYPEVMLKSNKFSTSSGSTYLLLYWRQ